MYLSPSGAQQRETKEFAPLLFSIQPIDIQTPRASTPIHTRTVESSMSGQRRSVTPPGSMHIEATPPHKPPIERLGDYESGEIGVAPPLSSYSYGGPTAVGSESVILPELLQVLPPGDCWVTVYGFQEPDLQDVFDLLSANGTILSWGTFGVSQTNFIHVQFENQHQALKALQFNGTELPGNDRVIIGVKPLSDYHKRLRDGYAYQEGEGHEYTVRHFKQKYSRSYKLDPTLGQQNVPQPFRSIFSKVMEYVVGV